MLRTKKARDLKVGETFYLEQRIYIGYDECIVGFLQCKATRIRDNHVGYETIPDDYYNPPIPFSQVVFEPCKEIDYCNRLYNSYYNMEYYTDRIKSNILMKDAETATYKEISELTLSRVQNIEEACHYLERAFILLGGLHDED